MNGTASYVPSQYSSEQRRVEALRRREPPLHLGHRDFVLGRRAEEGEAARHGAEDVGGGGHEGHEAAVAAGLARVLVPGPDDQVVVVHLEKKESERLNRRTESGEKCSKTNTMDKWNDTSATAVNFPNFLSLLASISWRGQKDGRRRLESN